MTVKPNKYHLSIVLTNQCNLNCVYCYEHHKHKGVIPIGRVKEIITEYLNSHYEEVEIDFFGGEPFLEFETIRNVCEWVWSKEWKAKYVFFATTNGTLVHGEIAEWLRKHKERFWVSLSLDGRKESHDINRSNSFDSIDLDFFKECWPTQTVKMTISKETVHHIYEDIVYIHSLGYKMTGTNFAEGLDWEDETFVEIVAAQFEKLSQYYIAHPEIEIPPLLNMALFKCEEPKTEHKWCGCGEYMAAFETDGKKYPCTFFTPMTFTKEQLDNVLHLDWSDPKNFIDYDCYHNCYLEPVCSSCYGANLLSNGVLNKRDRSRCKLIELRAIYSAAIAAQRILQNPQDTYENALTIKAIQRIHELYNVLKQEDKA